MRRKRTLTRTEKLQRKLRREITAIIVFAVAVCVALILVHSDAAAADQQIPEHFAELVAESGELAPAEVIVEAAVAEVCIIEHYPEPPAVDVEAAELLAKTVWGEARSCSTTEQAAVIWCVLNRVDAGYGTITAVITAPCQFVGYSPENPVDSDILRLANDVLIRWQTEAECVGSVGRVLPSDYLWFHGDGTRNYFRNEYTATTYWDWSLPSPY